MSYNPPMDNDLLTLWLKAGRGLAPDEARELVQRLADEKADHDAYCAEVETEREETRDAAANELAQAQDAAEAWEQRARTLADFLRKYLIPPEIDAVLVEIDAH